MRHAWLPSNCGQVPREPFERFQFSMGSYLHDSAVDYLLHSGSDLGSLEIPVHEQIDFAADDGPDYFDCLHSYTAVDCAGRVFVVAGDNFVALDYSFAGTVGVVAVAGYFEMGHADCRPGYSTGTAGFDAADYF